MWNKTGFTLLELVLTIIILGFSTIILVPYFQAITQSPDPLIRQQAIALGQAMVDEILAKRWDEFTPVGGGPIRSDESPSGTVRLSKTLDAFDPLTAIATEEGSRADYDDVDDYDGSSENNTFYDQTGGSFTMRAFQRDVAVDYIASNSNPVDNTAVAAGSTDTKRIMVTITSPRNEEFVFVAVSCNL